MEARTYHHFGVPTGAKRADAAYIEGAKVFVTDPEKDPYRIEFLHFEADSPMPAEVCTNPHVAFLVPSLDEELEGKDVLIPPFDATPELRCAFIRHGAAIIELMERRK